MSRFSSLILGALVIQALALSLFLLEFIGSIFDIRLFRFSWDVHEFIELISIISMALGSGLTLTLLLRSLKRTDRVEEQLKFASDAFHGLMMEKFSEWKLTDMERDTALMMVKGMSIAEIAELKDRKAGTIKTHISAVYQKSELAGRAQFMSYFMEEMTRDL